MAPQDPSPPPIVHEIAYNHETAMAWMTMTEDEPILLLVPDIPTPPASSNGVIPGRKAFRDLQMKLSAHHPGEIRLVDYDPVDGIEHRHTSDIDECPTLLLIICEPAGLDSEQRQESVEFQVDFAEDAMEEYTRLHEGTVPDEIIAVYCRPGPYVAPKGIKTCLRVDNCMEEHWASIAKWLIEGGST